MATRNTNEKVFRKFEKEVLDKHHKTLALWRRDRRNARYAALAQFDCNVISTVLSPPDPSRIGQLQLLKNLEEGLSEAFRWLHDGSQQFNIKPTDDPNIIEEAGKFCQFAGKYVNIADFHKMYGRKQVDIEVDEVKKRVRFVIRNNIQSVGPMLGMAEQSHRLGNLPLVSDPSSQGDIGEKLFSLLRGIEYKYMSGHIALPDVSIANDENIKRQFELAIPQEPLRLNDHEDLGGFTVSEFDQFYNALRRWSFCCTFGFLLSIMELGKQQWECAPTQCIERSEFYDSLRKLTGLPDSTLFSIVQRLSYDRRTGWPDLYQQPLFCGDKTISWSASVVQNSRQLRNMLKLMSRTKELQNHAATLIGRREAPMLQEISNLFSHKGKTENKLNTPISKGKEKGEIDILVYNKQFPDEILIIEGKALLGVDEINEVDAATKEMQKGQNQLSKVKRILSKMNIEEKS
ncbi:hypothetical protein [Gimesia algae]|uniref:Uncharacterized protein n=1 Tax=Gimesia algae TaxID=2527971 RepID=A0A517VDM7_9PLAN|nr:hypothetical protein [Gimesia algae]QDT91111.1 hypothetical protein Pan161_27660 [Gimesia algae]